MKESHMMACVNLCVWQNVEIFGELYTYISAYVQLTYYLVVGTEHQKTWIKV